MELKKLFYPQSVAVFGSAGEGKLANVLAGRLLDGGMKRVVIVNPKGISGTVNAKGYPSLPDVPDAVDLAVIAAPAHAVNGILEDCGRCGVRACIIISSGFSEAGNADGEKQIIETARRHGIAFIGPNCAGMVCTQGNLVATLETSPPRGNISIISQSGAVGGAFMSLSALDGAGISKFISYGNGGNLTVLELMRFLKDDPDTRVIALYLETIPSGREFMAAVQAVGAAKPIVIVKAGRTDTGLRAALSHTGSMAGADAVCDAALRQCGAIRVQTLADLFELSKGFSMMPPVTGKRLAVVTNSGGPGVMTADRAEESGLLIPETSPNVRALLGEKLPPFAGLENPIDLTVEGTAEQYGSAIEIALSESDCAIALYIGTPYLKSLPIAAAIAEAAKKTGKPVAAVMQVGSDINLSLSHLREQGIATFPSGEAAAAAISAMASYEQRRQGETALPCVLEAAAKGRAFQDGTNRLLEPDAMALLGKNGIATPSFAFAKSEEETSRAARRIGYPVVVKIVSPDIIHKSDCGGVRLNIRDDSDAIRAFRHMKEIAASCDFRGVMIYPMLEKGKEVIIGLTNDPSFGPLVAFGMGGVYTEVLRDITFRVAPITKAEAKKMIQEIKMYPLLCGVRGERASDLEALSDMISKFSLLPLYYPDIQEADLNPVFLYEKGAQVADVRILGK